MAVASFFAEHKEMLHRLSAGLCLSRASAAKRQAKNDRNYSNRRHSKPPRYQLPTQLFFMPEPVNSSHLTESSATYLPFRSQANPDSAAGITASSAYAAFFRASGALAGNVFSLSSAGCLYGEFTDAASVNACFASGSFFKFRNAYPSRY